MSVAFNWHVGLGWNRAGTGPMTDSGSALLVVGLGLIPLDGNDRVGTCLSSEAVLSILSRTAITKVKTATIVVDRPSSQHIYFTYQLMINSFYQPRHAGPLLIAHRSRSCRDLHTKILKC
uniref:Uncharacterized protein n=1 Tax=Romanomermis culicivorax TaxID=13658 RepID=A0A915JB95_ROMCU